MAHIPITLEFPFPLNVSVQVGDVAYYCNTQTVGIHDSGDQSGIIEIGEIAQITPWDGNKSTIVCNSHLSLINFPSLDSFIMFSKDNKANLSSLVGYYSEVKFVNDSSDKGELFAIGCGFSESSK
jgi:hypothetical protein